MKRVTVNFIVDSVSFVDFALLAITGFILKFVLPSGTGGLGREIHNGSGREHIKELLSMSRHDWGKIHFYLSVIFVLLMILHIVLHWSWIKNYMRCRPVKDKNQCERID